MENTFDYVDFMNENNLTEADITPEIQQKINAINGALKNTAPMYIDKNGNDTQYKIKQLSQLNDEIVNMLTDVLIAKEDAAAEQAAADQAAADQAAADQAAAEAQAAAAQAAAEQAAAEQAAAEKAAAEKAAAEKAAAEKADEEYQNPLMDILQGKF